MEQTKGLLRSLTILSGLGATVPLINDVITVVPEVYALVFGAASGLIAIYRRLREKKHEIKEIKGIF